MNVFEPLLKEPTMQFAWLQIARSATAVELPVRTTATGTEPLVASIWTMTEPPLFWSDEKLAKVSSY